jgi:hypothetical protein
MGVVVAVAVLGAGIYLATRSSESNKGDSMRAVTAERTPTELTQTNTTAETTARAQNPRPRPQRRRPTPAAPLNAADRESFEELEQRLGGASGLAVSGIGFDQPVSEVGTLREGPAWSTIKVPIALAIEARANGRPSDSERSLMSRAISLSDNAAAQALWDSFGSPEEAAAAVETILREAGDSSTRVETTVVRPPFTSFGQTLWTLAEQQRFIAALPCLRYGDDVMPLMADVADNQQWGLKVVDPAAYVKGGWGPDPSGRYLARQIGILEFSNGRQIAVSMATVAADGSFASATSNLDEIARWVSAHVEPGRLVPGRCES